jgi:hypothetical protein
MVKFAFGNAAIFLRVVKVISTIPEPAIAHFAIEM